MQLHCPVNPRVMRDLLRDDQADTDQDDQQDPMESLLIQACIAADVVEEIIRSVGDELFPPIRVTEEPKDPMDPSLDPEINEMFRLESTRFSRV